jgi:CubicO group peptidase (beta-lactamase class C family)
MKKSRNKISDRFGLGNMAFGHVSKVLFILGIVVHVRLVHGGGSTDQLSVSAKGAAAFVEEFAAKHIGTSSPGMSVAIVKNGKTLYAGGFGMAEMGGNIPMHARSLVRVGSLSKLFTTTAVLQLRDSGKLKSLDEKIENLLPGTLPKVSQDMGVSGSLTLRQILTHTAGLEDKILGSLVSKSKLSVANNGTSFLEHFPRAIRNPGGVPAESNHAFALLGHLITTLSEQEFDDFVQEHIFSPLQMKHSTHRVYDPNDPVAQLLAEGGDQSDTNQLNMAVGYSKESISSFSRSPDMFSSMAPSGGLVTTASDMAEYLKMILSKGENGGRILSSNSVKEMCDTHVRAFPGASSGKNGDGIALTWYEQSYSNGMRVLQHFGEIPGFASLAAIIPLEKLGVFVAFNVNDNSLRQTFLNDFVTRFSASDKSKRPAVAPVNVGDLNSYVGSYRPTRSSYSSFEYALSLPNQLLVSVSPSGQLTLQVTTLMSSAFSPPTFELVPVSNINAPSREPVQRAGPVVVFSVISKEASNTPQSLKYVAFLPGGTEATSPAHYMVTNVLGLGTASYEPIKYYGSFEFVVQAAKASHITFAAFLALWMLLGLFRAIFSGSGKPREGPPPARLENIAAFTCISFLGFSGLLALGVWKNGGFSEILAHPRLPSSLRIIFFGSFLCQISTVSLVANIIQEGRRHSIITTLATIIVGAAAIVTTVIHYELRFWIMNV